MVNCLITNSVRVNVLVNGKLCRVTTGDDHEEAGTPDPRALELALRFWLGHRRQQRLTRAIRPNRRIFHAKIERRSATRRGSSLGVSAAAQIGGGRIRSLKGSAKLRELIRDSELVNSLLGRSESLVNYRSVPSQPDRSNDFVVIRKVQANLLLVPERSQEI